MASDSIDLNLNIGGGSNSSGDSSALIHSIDKLTNKLSGFESAVNKFVTNTNNYRSARNLDPDLIKARLTAAEASKLRAQFLGTNEGSTARKNSAAASLLNAELRSNREAENRKYRAKADEAYTAGDYRTGDRYAKLVQNSTSKGVEDGMTKLLKAGTVIASAKFLSGALSRSATIGGQISQAALGNPLLNYDYGSQVSSILSLGAQQHYSNLGAIITGAGTGIGGLIGGLISGGLGTGVGAGIGAGVGSSIADFVGASGNAKATVQAQALGEFLNQRNITSSLQGTNSAAYNILTNKSGYTPYSQSGELDPVKPFMNEIAKGAAVYDKNFTAIDQLTNYAISAQIPIAKLASFSGSIAQLRLNNSQIDNLGALANTYGVDPTDLANRAVMFMQGGMGKDTALNTAAQSFQNVSGFQALQSGFYQGGYLDRDKKDILAKYTFGLDFEKVMAGDPAENAKVRHLQQKASGKFGDSADFFSHAVLDALGLTQNTYNLNNPETRGITSARMSPSSYQQKSLDLIKKTRVNAINGNFDPSQITKDMSELAGTTANVTDKMQAFGSALDTVIGVMNSITGGVHNPYNGHPAPASNGSYVQSPARRSMSSEQMALHDYFVKKFSTPNGSRM